MVEPPSDGPGAPAGTGPTATVADVVLLLPLARTYSYRIPEALRGAVRRGVQVMCPVRGRPGVQGLVADVREPRPSDPDLQDIEDVVRTRPPWPDDLSRLVVFMSSYYVAPLGVAARTAMPGLFSRRVPKPSRRLRLARPPDRPPRSERVRSLLAAIEQAGGLDVAEAGRIVPGTSEAIRRYLRQGILVVEEDASVPGVPARSRGAPAEAAGSRHALTRHQAAALQRIVGALGKGFTSFLLHGVTGSGKTEVYLRAIEEVRARGLGALVLVPEIALTVELRRRFEERFGAEVAVLHSALPEARRAAVWEGALQGRIPLVVGARSAVFAPVQYLGLIVVDEEHDASYKQQEHLRYNARDLAVVRASYAGCPVVLGSATPSLESFENTHAGKAVYLSMPERVEKRPLPEVRFVDLRYEAPIGSGRVFSATLLDALRETVGRGESAILFLNRRGFGRFVVCGTCGQAIQCPNCSITLTHHARPERLNCHYCDHSAPVPERCPACGSSECAAVGFGTERLEDEVKGLVPGARCERLDSDTATGRGLDRILSRFRSGEVNVLVGTQIVAKGHDFPSVTLVGVLLADQSLAFPDFRASERTFQLLTQVAGRAGRGDRPGLVVIQTFNPAQYSLRFAANHDYVGFAPRARVPAARAPRDRRGLVPGLPRGARRGRPGPRLPGPLPHAGGRGRTGHRLPGPGHGLDRAPAGPHARPGPPQEPLPRRPEPHPLAPLAHGGPRPRDRAHPPGRGPGQPDVTAASLEARVGFADASRSTRATFRIDFSFLTEDRGYHPSSACGQSRSS